MPLYEVELKVRVAVHADDREEAKQHAVAIARRIPIATFNIVASRSLKELAGTNSGYQQRPIGK